MLSIENLNVFYGRIHALKNISMEIIAGELVSLIGVNGSGKTTTLRTISGILKPNSGLIKFGGRPISGLPPHKIIELGIGHVPEGRHCFPDMTVYENLEIGSFGSGRRTDPQEKFKLVFSLFPILNERRKQLARSLSGGEQQMLAIGRVLMLDPKLMLIDELSLGLAPLVVDMLVETLKHLQETGITMILVEQDIYTALEISGRTYVLETGKVVLSGNSKELLQKEEVEKALIGI